MSIFKKYHINKILIALTLFLIDRASKEYVINFFETNQIKELFLNNYLNIFLIWNQGVAFGLLNFDDQIIYNIITLIICLISIFVFVAAIRIKNYSSYFFIIIFGGALGNIYDRLAFKAVPDFIDLHINNYHWFIFNIADIFITVGVICLIFDEIIFNKKKDHEKNY